jgi:hypothetical protein
MKQVGPKIPISTSAVQPKTTVNQSGGVSNKSVEKTKTTAQQTVVTGPTTTFSEGVETTIKPDGSSFSKSQSGVESSTIPGGGQSISLPGEDKLKIDGDKIEIAGGGGKDAGFVENAEGIQLARYTDKAGNTVQVDPETLTYEVFNKNTHQVIYPDKEQAVLISGTQIGQGNKAKPYQMVAAFDADGNFKPDESSPEVLGAKNGKIQYNLEKGPTERSPLRPLPGQPAQTEQIKKTEAPPSQQNSAPTALLAEEPMLALAETNAPVESQTKETAPTQDADPTAAAKAAEAAAKAERKGRLDALKKVGPDFFDPSTSSDEVHFQKTPSGVIKRMDGESIAFSLPTGDQFRTDGDVVAVLGDNPRAKNARLVEEDGKTFLAFNDKARNSYQLDVNNGDLSVSNSDGTMKQKLLADGSESITATSTHTSEAGTVGTSTHGILLEPDGKVARKSGFPELQMDKNSLVYTLPNGRTTVRNLLMETKGRVDEKKAPEAPESPGVKDEWGDTQSMIDQILGKTTPAAAAVNASGGDPPTANQTNGPGPINSNPFDQEPATISGVTRKTLPDGSVQTRLPSGVTFMDGENPTAKGPNGETLEVLKSEVPSEGGYILYAKGPDGIGYTIAPDHLDYIAEGRDGKVHQLVKSDGKFLTSITDGLNQHTHQFDGQTMTHNGSPGVYADIRTPGHIYVADQPQNRTYELPVPYPTPPGAPEPYGPPGPAMSSPPIEPSFWDKTKAFFTGRDANEIAATKAYGQAHHGCPSHIGGMPGSCHQYDPMAEEMRQMQRMNKTMMTMNAVGMGVSLLSTLAMPALFFGGMYY